MVSGENNKADFLSFITVDAWQMARETPEVHDDPSPHAPLKCHKVLAKLLLEADPTWLVEKASIIEALKSFIVFCKLELYGPLFNDAKRMDLLDCEDALALRAYAEKHGGRSQRIWWAKRFSPSPRRPE